MYTVSYLFSRDGYIAIALSMIVFLTLSSYVIPTPHDQKDPHVSTYHSDMTVRTTLYIIMFEQSSLIVPSLSNLWIKYIRIYFIWLSLRKFLRLVRLCSFIRFLEITVEKKDKQTLIITAILCCRMKQISIAEYYVTNLAIFSLKDLIDWNL